MLVQRLHLSSYYPDNFLGQEQELVQDLGYTYLFSEELSPETEIILSTSQIEWEKYPPSHLENIKLVIHPNSGFDNFSFETFKTFSAPVILGNQLRSNAVAEYAMACLFQHFCAIPWARQWDQSRSFPYRKLLSETQVLLFGFGPVGTLLFDTLTSLQSRVTLIDPYKNHFAQLQQESQQETLKENQFDAIIVACSLNDMNHQFINKKILKSLSPTGCLINPARGKLVHQQDLLNHLKQNERCIAYLDVTDPEPFNPRDFDGIANLKLTSHIAGVHDELTRKVLNFEKDILLDFKHYNRIEFCEKHQDILLQNRAIENSHWS